jgi:hypothetical protein
MAKCEYCGLFGALGRCGGCGAPNEPVRAVAAQDGVEWLEITVFGDAKRRYVQGIPGRRPDMVQR